jgi:hypothetical protein
MKRILVPLLVAITGLTFALPGPAAEPDWVDAMRQVAAKGQARKGVLVNLGDSITYSMAYFAPLQFKKQNMSPAMAEAFETVDGRMRKECYRWKGVDRGNMSGKTAAWALKQVDGWLTELKPEVAIVMFGTNDIRRGSVDQHAANLRKLVQRCLDKGVVVILSTIPPMAGHEEKVDQAAAAQRKIAAELNVPLIDFHAHVLNRRPKDWNGKLPRFAGFSRWEVPTLISQDGVHPSNPKQWQNDYSEHGLCRNGNVLRSYLSLMAYAEVVNVVLEGRKPTGISTQILGPNPPKPDDLPKIDSPQAASTSVPRPEWMPKAPPLPKPRGEVIEVNDVKQLFAAVEKVKPGGTIMMADGRYFLPLRLVIHTDNVTLRGKSGDPTKVILDGAKNRHNAGAVVHPRFGTSTSRLSIFMVSGTNASRAKPADPSWRPRRWSSLPR